MRQLLRGVLGTVTAGMAVSLVIPAFAAGWTGGTSAVDVTAAGGVTQTGEAVAVTGGREFGLALLSNGTVDGWGRDEHGQLGIGTRESVNMTRVGGLQGVTALAAGEAFALAVLSNGTVMSWGGDEEGELGRGGASIPEAIPALEEVTQVAAGDEFGIALRRNGTVMSWGNDEAGQLGTGALQDYEFTPREVPGLSEVVAIAAGGENAAALMRNGTVEVWGDNHAGQLGDGSDTGPEICRHRYYEGSCSRHPVTVGGLSGVTAVSAGNSYYLALLRGGAVEAWGLNGDGQLGDGTRSGPEFCEERGSTGHAGWACAMTPVAAEVGGASAISAGEEHSAALTGGTIRAWGGGSGQVGGGTEPSVVGPPGVVTFVSAPISGPTLAVTTGSQVGFSRPNAVALGGGDLWVSDPGDGRLAEFNANRELLAQVNTGEVIALAANSSGDAYALTGGGVQEYGPAGEALAHWATGAATAIAVDGEGDVWIDRAIANRAGPIEEFGASGAPRTSFGSPGTAPGKLEFGLGMAFSGGHLYVAEPGRIQEFTTGGVSLASFDEGGSVPRGIAASPATGDLYVTQQNDTVAQFSPSGTPLSQFGSAGSGNGQLSAPRGVAASAADVYVADSENNRVVEWSDEWAEVP